MRGTLRVTAIVALYAALLSRGGVCDSRPPLRGDDLFAALSFDPSDTDTAAGRSRIEPLVAQARRRGAAYVVLPPVGFHAAGRADSLAAADAPLSDALSQFLSSLAQRYGVRLVASVPQRAGASRFYASMTLWNRGGEVLFSRAAVMPQEPVSPRLVRGDALAPLESVDDGHRRLGVLAGEDLVAGVPRLASRGAETILVSANVTARDTATWSELCKRLAAAHHVNLIVAATRADHTGIFRREGLPTIVERVDSAEIAYGRLPRPSASEPSRPLGLPTIPTPTVYEPTDVLIDIGRELFFDRRLSRDGTVSCATCHQPERAFTNGQRTGRGVFGRHQSRNVPTLLNVAFKGALFWDGGSATLEHQVKFPMSHRAEMGVMYLDAAEFVRSDAHYAERFRQLSANPISFEDVARALASYERTLVSGASAFDRFYYGKESGALGAGAQRGLRLFTGKARCAICHQIGATHALFLDQTFHNTGVGYTRTGFTDLGQGALSDSSRSGFFFTPSLRNVDLTAPYMHDGSIPTLEQVVDFYSRGGVSNPYLDEKIRPLALSGQERLDLVQFLRSLTGTGTYAADGRPSQALFTAVRYLPSGGRSAGNTAALTMLVRRAARAGARVIVLPEHGVTGVLTGQTSSRVEHMARGVEQSRSAFRQLARELHVWLVVPLLEYDGAVNRFYLTTNLIDDNGVRVASSRKLKPRPEFGDGVASQGGDRTLKSIETTLGRLGLLSGDDLSDGVPRLAERGAQTILVSASWRASDGVDWTSLARQLAAQYRVNLVVSNAETTASAPSFTSIVLSGGALATSAKADGRTALVSSVLQTERAASVAPPLGLPSIPVPAHVQVTPESVERGRELFFDKRLSKDGTVSCATCHDPDHAFTDGLKVARGVYGRSGTRNTPTLLNLVYRPFVAWDGSVQSPVEQVARALRGWSEMDNSEGLADRAEIDRVAHAITDYLRTLLSGASRFDRYYYAGERLAISDDAKKGFELFRTKGGCAKCHHVTAAYALFTDNEFHNTGVGYHPRFQYLGYAGDGLEVNFARFNNFKGEYVTPSLRNIALTAPYMHDGSLATLTDVVHFYNTGGVANPFLDERIKPLHLTAHEEALIVRFLETLNGGGDAPGGRSVNAAHYRSVTRQ